MDYQKLWAIINKFNLAEITYSEMLLMVEDWLKEEIYKGVVRKLLNQKSPI